MSRLSELVIVVELSMMVEFGMDELRQGRRGSLDFSIPLELTSMFPISIEFSQLTLEDLFAASYSSHDYACCPFRTPIPLTVGNLTKRW